jgi:hypothetical protein
MRLQVRLSGISGIPSCDGGIVGHAPSRRDGRRPNGYVLAVHVYAMFPILNAGDRTARSGCTLVAAMGELREPR